MNKQLTVEQFYAEVCVEAERTILLTQTTTGAHWNAMKKVLKRYGMLSTAEYLLDIERKKDLKQ